MSDAVDAFVAALGPLLVRRFREDLYARLGSSAPVPLRDGTYPLLTALAERPATAAEVSARVGVDRTVASRQASALVEAGLVARTPDPTDARGALLTLTPAGREATARLAAETREMIRALGLPGDDLAAATRVLIALTKALADGR